jgi:predicted exporter
VHTRVGQADEGRLVVVLAPDVETALERNDAVAGRLEQARAAGAIGGFRSLHALLFARTTQVANEAAVRADPTLPARVRRAYAAAGFRPGAFAPFEQALAAAPPEPLTLEALEASPLGPLARNFLVPLDDGVALLSHVRDVHDDAALERAAAAAPDSYAFHPSRFLNDVFAQLRATTFQQIGVGYALVILLVVLRYRRPRASLAAVVPSLLVTLLLLGAAAAAGIELNLLHVVSLDMVIGMGVDYSVFLVDARRHGEKLGATVTSLVLCCLTTVFTFGMMALSVHPALSAIGTTVGAGVLLSLVCAPVSLLLLGDATPHG